MWFRVYDSGSVILGIIIGSGQVGDQAQHCLKVERLAEDSAHGVRAISGLPEPSCHEGYFVTAAKCSHVGEALADIEAAEPWHGDVQQHSPRSVRCFEKLDGCRAILQCLYLIPFKFQQLAQ